MLCLGGWHYDLAVYDRGGGPAPGTSETLISVFQPLVSPLTTSGIVLIFVTFFLFEREDLRNRFIRLAGSGDIERTTAALDDAGRRYIGQGRSGGGSGGKGHIGAGVLLGAVA